MPLRTCTIEEVEQQTPVSQLYCVNNLSTSLVRQQVVVRDSTNTMLFTID